MQSLRRYLSWFALVGLLSGCGSQLSKPVVNPYTEAYKLLSPAERELVQSGRVVFNGTAFVLS